MKILKVEKDNNSEWFSVQIKDKTIEIWIDVCILDNDFKVDWNKYIFNLSNSKDLEIKAYQENIDNFIECSEIAIQAVENYLLK